MVAIRRNLKQPKVEWRTTSPLWAKYRKLDNDIYQRPVLLRFNSDEFMDDFVDMIQTAPKRIHEWRLRRETWRLPPTTPTLGEVMVPDNDPDPQELELEQLYPKLYQPAHERYYLVAASLVCRIVGLPDKTLDTTCDERAAFVMRRRMENPEGQFQEYSFVNGIWEPAPFNEIHPSESTYPLFPVAYDDPLQEQERRLFAGMVPVSQREKMLTAKRVEATSFLPAPQSSTEQEASRIEHLLTVLDADVIQPWQAINNAYVIERKILDNMGEEAIPDTKLDEFSIGIDKIRDRLQVSSWYVMLDFVYYLQVHMPDFWDLIKGNPDQAIPTNIINEPAGKLWEALQDATFIFENRTGQITTNRDIIFRISRNKLEGYDHDDDTGTITPEPADSVSLAQALLHVANAASDLETLNTEYIDTAPLGNHPPNPWPDSRFLLCGHDVRDLVNTLTDLIEAYFNDEKPDLTQRVPIIPLASQISEEVSNDIKVDYSENTFIIRCVYIRPCCKVGAGRYTLSKETEIFTLAAFFDPDAPARPIRIPMPIDTTPAGLRKFAKNTMFVLSDTLACQVKAARKLSFGDLVLSVLPWPFHKDLPDDISAEECKPGGISFGMLCTLSIPIITIVALILLIIMVLLLNSIFFWLPFLIFCLPLPGLKAKK